MKTGNFIKAVSAIILLVGAISAQVRPVGGLTTMSFNKAGFDQSLQNAVGPNVIGYQYVLIKNGQVVSEKAGGVAQNAADGTLAMTTSTPTNIGSVAKFLSGTAMIGLMEKSAGPFVWDPGATLQQKLNRKFFTIVPSVWKTGAKAGVENITIRQLLQHRSGFDDAKANNRNVLGFLKDADGFQQSQFDQREYSNINFVLNGYLLPMYATSSFKDNLNNLVSQQNLNQTDGDAYVRQMAGTAMHNLMKSRIWDKMTPKIAPNCDGTSLSNTAAFGYTSKNDSAQGAISSIMDSQGHCGGHGGYFMSSRALAAYLAHFSASDLIVTSAGRNAMYNESMNPNDRLVWSSSTPNNWLGAKFKMPNVIWSNGIAGGYRSVILRLPQNYYLVLLTNSPDLSVSQLQAAGVNAFIAGMQHNF
ncbi:MAG TPA: serine hydrolase domain-containing protein [Pyrinomonadaceae bacterium]